MGISHYIKEIGRGKAGARSLTHEQARDLMGQILDARVTDLELGGFALAMRIKGESVDELRGFLAATTERCVPIASTGRPTVILPSYNGARKLPNLTALLALLLAQEDIAVLVHGPRRDAARVSTCEVFEVLGLPVAARAEDIDTLLRTHDPVFVPTEVLCGPLARLLDVRRVVGLRNSGHTVAKMLDPIAPGPADAPVLRVVNYTHPEYRDVLSEWARAAGIDAMLLRGTEGEPVADPRRLPRMDVYLDGQARPELSVMPQEGSLTELPLLPREHDAVTTAVHIQGVVSGEQPAPVTIDTQVGALVQALGQARVERFARESLALQNLATSAAK